MQIPIADLPFTATLIKDYLLGKPSLKDLYTAPWSTEVVMEQCRKKKKSFQHREILVEVLTAQMSNLECTELQVSHVQKLKEANTFSITTGHQLNLFTGPLYFIYKIIQVAKMANTLNAEQSEFHFVPIFWMATEDHDFEEINHCYLNHQKITWDSKQTGAVGRYTLEGIQKACDELFVSTQNRPFAESIRAIITESYQEGKTLSEATRSLVHHLMKEWGVLILDADNTPLKKALIPYIEKELHQESLWNETANTRQFLKEQGYKIQVNPREINLFYIRENTRNRIVKKGDEFLVLDTDWKFSKEEIQQELQLHPDRFSPNAVMRPLYQEVILPNVAYVGGNGEIAYWLELKAYFDSQNINFPILLPRNSLLWLSEKNLQKITKLGLLAEELFLPTHAVEKKIVQNFSTVDLEMGQKRNQIEALYADLISKSEATDKSLRGLLEAQKHKQLKAFDQVERRLIKAEKRVWKEKIEQYHRLRASIFPEGIFQERRENTFEYYQNYGKAFLSNIYETISYEQTVLNIKEL